MRRKLIFGIIGLILGVGIGGNASVHAGEPIKVSGDEAYTVAVNFVLDNTNEKIFTEVDGDLYNHGIKETEIAAFPDTFAISSINSLYGKNGDVTAYYCQVQGEDKKDAGYVIVNADREKYPVVEFATTGTFFVNKAIREIKLDTDNSGEESLYYLGNYCYGVKVGDKYYDLEEDGYQEIDGVESFEDYHNTEENIDENDAIRNEWEMLLRNSGASNPPVGTYITAPNNYENGYQGRTTDYCYGMGSTYFEMTEFSAGGVCTPTAGTNLCLYWTRRDSAYSNLKKTNWQTTFNRIYTLMGTSTTDGTYWPDPARTGIRNYFRERGYSSTNAYYSTCTSTTHFNDYIKAEINAGRPVLVATWGDEYYGDHTVLGLGYIRYKYNGVYSSHYIQIADGWTSSVNRYIHYETGRDSMMRIKVVPGN